MSEELFLTITTVGLVTLAGASIVLACLLIAEIRASRGKR